MSETTTPIPISSNPLAMTNPAARGAGPRIPVRIPGFVSGAGPIPGATLGGGSVPNANVLNSVASPARDLQAQVIAENAPLRLVYGRAMIGAQIADVLFYNGVLIIFVVWGQGLWNAIESVWLDGKAPPSGVSVTSYTGSQVAADATLVAAYAAQSPAITYTDILPGIAYSVIVLPPYLTSGFPSIAAIVQGLKIYDPRDGTQTLGVPSTYKYSACPALAIGDIQTNTTYGAGGAVDWASVTTTANTNDALVGGTEKRRTLGLVIDTMQPLTSWLEAMRTYAGCFLARNGASLVLVPDRPASSVFTFSENTGNAKISNVKRRTKRDVPTVSAIRYTDTSVVPWRDNFAYAYAAGVLAGTTPWKLHEVAMPGIQRGSQATREATEQLNKLALTDLAFDIAGQDESLAVVVGDVITATAHVGISARQARVINVATPTLGRPIFSVEGYDPAVYSDSVAAGPSIVDTNLPSPAAIPSPVGPLVITEVPYLEQINGSSVAGSLIYQSRFDVTWTAPSSTFPITYRVEVWDGALRIRDEMVSSPAYSTPTVQQGKTYTIKVYSRNSITENATPLTNTGTALGNLLPPSPIPSITAARELGGRVLIDWTQSPSVDTARYEWRYFPNGIGTWASATFIDRVDGLHSDFPGLPVGAHRFYGDSVNSVGRYSGSPVSVDITVTSDANAFIQSRTFTAPTLTNMISIPVVEDGLNNIPRWATAVASDVFTAVEPNPFNSGGNPVISYHASATQKWQGETWDLGYVVTGDWTLSTGVTNLIGAATYALETSPDGSTWTPQPGISWKGSTRYIRPAINNLTSGTMIVTGAPKISLAALSKTESGKVTTLASNGKLVQLTGTYSAAQDLQATAINATAAGSLGTSSPRIVVADRVLLHPQSGLQVQWTTSGAGAGDAYCVFHISSAARTILADDYLEYDVFIDPTTVAALRESDGGIFIEFTAGSGGGNADAATDVAGYLINRAAVGMDPLARGMWYSRKIAMGAFAGKVTDKHHVGGNSDADGAHKVIFRNIRYTNGAGTTRLTIWSSGEPSVSNTIGFQSFVVAGTAQCGPSNSFLLYAFTDAGAQTAQDCQYSFRGF